MALRFRKSIKILPGVRININKKSSSISFGGKGFRHTISSTGRKTTTVGIPGTGLSYSSTHKGNQPAVQEPEVQYKTTWPFFLFGGTLALLGFVLLVGALAGIFAIDGIPSCFVFLLVGLLLVFSGLRRRKFNNSIDSNCGEKK